MIQLAPRELGRSIVVLPGAAVPEAWGDAPRFRVDAVLLADDGGLARVVGELQRRYVNRSPFVVELDSSVQPQRDPVTDLKPYELGGEFTFLHERLIKAIWHNSYDGRAGDLKWWWTERALSISGVTRGGPADVTLADSTPTWIDGGPRQSLRLEHPLIHHESIELGRTAIVPQQTNPSYDLAPDQLEAVGHRVGPARIVAPAGSGKTRVLVSRLRHLIEDRAIEPELVTAVAYNNRAAAEMRSRLPEAWSPLVRTIHSLGLAIVRDARPGVHVIDEMEVRARLKAIAPAPPRTNTDVIAPYIDALQDVQVGLADPAEVAEATDDVPGFAEVFRKYRERLLRDGRVDYGEMVYGAIEALCRDPGLRRKWQGRCRHLLVDEFQDLTPGFLLLLRLLASPGMNVFGVGDDDQVIYGYEGASPEFLIDFAGLFPGAGAHALEVNYRCPADVVDASIKLLSHNRRRVVKTIRPAADATGLAVTTAPNPALAETARERIRQLIADGVAPKDIAVLSRVNSALIPVQVVLALEGIPFQSDIGPERLNRTVLRATFAWWRMALDPESMTRSDIFEAVRRPARGLVGALSAAIGHRRGPFSLQDLVELGERLEDRHQAKWEAFCDDIVAASAASTTSDLLDVLLNVVGLRASADTLDSGRSRVTSHHGDDLTALVRIAALCPKPSEFESWLNKTLAAPSRNDGVLLSSVHRVKGLEWDHALVFSADRDTMPHRLAADIEEERRVFHVAITRGRKSVTVIADEMRPSRFLEDMKKEYVPEPADPKPERESRRAPGPRTRQPAAVSVQLGDEIRVTGGYRGTVSGIGDEGVSIRVSYGAVLEVKWGERVQRGVESGPLVPGTESTDGGERARDSGLFERLKRWRLDKSRELGVPAFVVFTDRTLEELARRRPADERGLLAVHGIGSAKLEAYGDEILELLADARTET